MAFVTIQVFEHSKIRVGEPIRTPDGGEHPLSLAHHHALAAFAETTSNRYFSCGPRTIRFGSHVGLLQLGDLGIEVLPKADKNERGGYGRWHRALIRMLRVVGDLGLEAQDEAQLRTNPGRLFDLFIQRFLNECEQLVHQGLAKGYRTQEDNRTAFRGRLRVNEHIRLNATNAARFYVASPVYDHENVPNLALHEALRIVETLPLSTFSRARARAIRLAFPQLPRWRPDITALARLRPTRNTARYQNALRLARLILFHLAPDIRQGETPLLALLFDMNTLWERYVATLARRLHLPGLQARTQDTQTFYERDGTKRNLRPDITLRRATSNHVALVIDTKWKLPSGGEPSSADLKQMFCYHELFECNSSMLLYPSTTEHTFASEPGRFVGRDHRCTLAYLAIEGDTANELGSLFDVPAGPDRS